MLVKYLVMTFKAKDGSLVNLSVSGIKEGLTPEDIGDVMDVIIGKDTFITKGGSLIGKHNAQIITRNADEVTIV